jgi:hypothetical protein
MSNFAVTKTPSTIMSDHQGDAETEQIYVLAAGNNLFKVGLTSGPVKKRLKALSTGAARPLILVTSFQVPIGLGHYCERAAHLALEDQAATDAGGREFFRASSSAELCEKVRQSVQKVVDFHNHTADVLGEIKDTVKDTTMKDIIKDSTEETEDLDITVSLNERQRAGLYDMLARRRNIGAEIRRLELEKTLVEQEILRRFRGNLNDGPRPLLQWRYSSQRRIDLTQLRARHPDLAQALTRETTSRRPVFLC